MRDAIAHGRYIYKITWDKMGGTVIRSGAFRPARRKKNTQGYEKCPLSASLCAFWRDACISNGKEDIQCVLWLSFSLPYRRVFCTRYRANTAGHFLVLVHRCTDVTMHKTRGQASALFCCVCINHMVKYVSRGNLTDIALPAPRSAEKTQLRERGNL